MLFRSGTESPETEILVAEPDDSEAVFFSFVEDPQLRLTAPADAYSTAVERTGDGYRVTVTARTLVKDLCLFPDRLDPAAAVDSGLVTLPAGRSHTFVVTTEADLDTDALVTRPVLRSVNDLV